MTAAHRESKGLVGLGEVRPLACSKPSLGAAAFKVGREPRKTYFICEMGSCNLRRVPDNLVCTRILGTPV